MQKFIAIPELGIIVRKIAPNGRHFAGFGTRNPVEAYARWVQQCYANEDQFYWDDEFFDDRSRRYLRNINFKATTCSSSS